MQSDVLRILSEPIVRTSLKQAWLDSRPGPVGGHEEGGLVVREATGNLEGVRWATGQQGGISLPPHVNCRIGEADSIVSFHTHPNTGSDYLQEPGDTDRRAVSGDPDLKGASYLGELVVAQDTIYFIDRFGQVTDIAPTRQI